jgi:hypothetical protein
VLPWVAFAGAAAAIAGGAYYLSIGGKGTCTTSMAGEACPDMNDYAPNYVPLFGVGAALAVTGIVLLVIPGPAPSGTTTPSAGTPPSAVSALGLGLSPRGLSLSGRF